MSAWAEIENRTSAEIRAHHIAFRAKIAARAKFDTGVKCVSASQRQPPKVQREILVYPVIPEPKQTQNTAPEALDPVDKSVFQGHQIKVIQRLVCARRNVTMVDLLSAKRTLPVARARQIGMYLAKVTTGRSFPDIGRRFGNRDHTTALHAVRKITEMMAADPAFAAEVEAMRAELTGES